MPFEEALELARGAFCRAHLDTLQKRARGYTAEQSREISEALGSVSNLWLAKESLTYKRGDLLAFCEGASWHPGPWRVVVVGGDGTLVDLVNVATGDTFHGSSGQLMLGRAPALMVAQLAALPWRVLRTTFADGTLTYDVYSAGSACPIGRYGDNERQAIAACASMANRSDEQPGAQFRAEMRAIAAEAPRIAAGTFFTDPATGAQLRVIRRHRSGKYMIGAGYPAPSLRVAESWLRAALRSDVAPKHDGPERQPAPDVVAQLLAPVGAYLPAPSAWRQLELVGIAS